MSANPFENDPRPATPGNLDYEVLRRIGAGSYGEVWLVRDKSGCYRACKVVYRSQFETERPYEREYAGIQKFAPVSATSPSQIKILHVGRRDHDGYFYYIMELADDASGATTFDPLRYQPKTLKSEFARSGVLPVRDCVNIGISLAEALVNLHEHGLIHRDIKPANIIFVNGIPKLADIGLVTDANMTMSYVGTEGFIPPEGPTSPQSDIYGLGKVLYEISTGRDRMDFPELPTSIGASPERDALLELNSVIAKACHGDISKRYQTASEMRGELLMLRDGKSVRQTRTRQNYWHVFQRVAFLALVLAALVGAVLILQKKIADTADAVKLTPRIPLPDQSIVSHQEQQIRDAYREQLVSAAREVKGRIARDLLNRGIVLHDAALELATLRVAANLAAESGDTSQVLEVCNAISDRFIINPSVLKLEMLSHVGDGWQGAKNGAFNFTHASLAAAFDANASDDYTTARNLATLAAKPAATDTRLERERTFLQTEIDRREAVYTRCKGFIERLQKNPADAEANLECGKFLCFIKNDWPNGLTMLKRGSDLDLRALAAVDMVQPHSAAECLASGDRWWSYATSAGETRPFAERRARYWYLKALAAAATSEREPLKQQLSGKLNLVATEAAEIHISTHLATTELIEIYSDEIHWRSNGGSSNDKINHVLVRTINRNTSVIIPNRDATRFLPDAVDFSSAKMTINHKPKKRGKASMEIFDDHVRIRLSDPPSGSIELDVTVSFGVPLVH